MKKWSWCPWAFCRPDPDDTSEAQAATDKLDLRDEEVQDLDRRMEQVRLRNHLRAAVLQAHQALNPDG